MTTSDSVTQNSSEVILTIRDLKSSDFEAWLVLWRGYLDFYRQDIPEPVTSKSFEDLVAKKDGLFALVAVDQGGDLLGFTHSVVHRSTWLADSCCYLEDLYVSPAARGTDLGRRLIEATGTESKDQGAVRLYWHTQQYNGRARSLYDHVGSLTSKVLYEKNLA